VLRLADYSLSGRIEIHRLNGVEIYRLAGLPKIVRMLQRQAPFNTRDKVDGDTASFTASCRALTPNGSR
jgi:hypothetical protein